MTIKYNMGAWHSAERKLTKCQVSREVRLCREKSEPLRIFGEVAVDEVNGAMIIKYNMGAWRSW
ncbi:MAG: hypothetical protein MJ237_02180 [bacterium]|nr:hypothetical protein [bacterium]